MPIKGSLESIGKYASLMPRIFTLPDRPRMFFREYINHIYRLGLGSLPIVFIVSFFFGAVVVAQLKYNILESWMPGFSVGYAVREMMLLEFSSTVMCLILSGKIGSNIASELGSMRITQQIDALEAMGVNSANYLILPRITSMITIMPALVTMSILASFIGAYVVCGMTNILSFDTLTYGLRFHFHIWHLWASLIKSEVFAFIITSVPAYFGYTVRGGSQEVGRASTDAVVTSSVLILIADLALTQLMMS